MVGKAILAALAASTFVCSASAEGTGEGLNLGLMHWIRDTVCAPDETILFIPVSNDVPTLDMTYAVVPADHLDTISAHVVTREQRLWLSANGCHAAQERPQVMAKLTSGDAESGDLDF